MVRERIVLAQQTTTTTKSAKKLSQMDALQRKREFNLFNLFHHFTNDFVPSTYELIQLFPLIGPSCSGTMEACIAEEGQRGHLIVSSYGKFIPVHGCRSFPLFSHFHQHIIQGQLMID